MNGFEDREKAFEKKFEHDETLEFKIASHSARLFGMWAASQLGLKGAEAETYVREATDLAVKKSGRADLMAKAEKDFQAKGLNISRHRIEREMGDIYLKAREQIGRGKP